MRCAPRASHGRNHLGLRALAGEGAAIPMENPYCSCELTRVRPKVLLARLMAGMGKKKFCCRCLYGYKSAAGIT